jgi:hypothetical protein
MALPHMSNLNLERAVFARLRQITSIVLSAALGAASPTLLFGFQAPGSPPPASEGSPLAAAPQSANDLQSLVAPIALYPDALVAQILTASTFPDQVAIADNWIQQNKNLTGSALMQEVNTQSWDPSVKALTQFPSVLDNLAKNLAWTSSLGEAYHNQQSDVMTAIQTLRAQAKASGNLKSGSQITVVQQSPQTIVIQPTNPQVVYVPQYNPAVVYGTPYTTPGYSTGDVVAAGIIGFGAGIAVGAMMSGGCCAWGWSSWNCGWHGTAVVYHGGAYYGNAAWHGGYYGGGGAAYGPYGSAHYGAGYNPSTGTYARGGSVSTPYGRTAAGQAYNPSTGAYGATRQTSNAYGNYGSSVYNKNGQTAYTQHQTTSRGSVGSVQTSEGGRGVAATGANGTASMGEAANGNKYGTANGNAYRNTGNGWQKNSGSGWNNVDKGSSAFSGMEGHSNGAGNSSGWSSRAESNRGWGSMHSSGFSGGRFSGGGSGGGGFHGGGRR